MQTLTSPSIVTDTINVNARDALRVSESRYRRLFETAQDGILLLNAETAQIEDVNPYLIEMLGYSHAEFLGKKLWEVGSFSDIKQSKEMFEQLQTDGYVRYKDLPLKTKAGTEIAVEFVSNTYDCEGVKVIQCNIRNISERKADQASILRHTQLYSALSQCNKAIVYSVTEKKLFRQVCRAAVQFGGMKMAWIGIADPETQVVRAVSSFGDDNGYLQEVAMSSDAESPFGQSPTGTAIRKNKPFWSQDFLNDPTTQLWHASAAKSGFSASASLPLRKEGKVVGAFTLYSGEVNSFDESARNLLIEMATDISFALDNFQLRSRHQKAAEDVERLAFYDPLTGLPNRRLLHDRLKHVLSATGRHNFHGAVLFIDLDNFKILNDTKGHSIGDLLLIEVAKRIKASVRDGDTVSRVGGDEFVVILEALSEDITQATSQTEIICNKILTAVNQTFALKSYEYQCSTSIGISMFRNQEITEEELLKHADTAMYQAKSAGRNTLCFYNATMQEVLESRAALESELRLAASKQQFQLYYQVQVDSQNRVIGAEALIRWISPQRGIVSPVDFIPIAEDTGLILLIGQWVLKTACAQLKCWQKDALTRDLTIAVNVSSAQFRQPDFVAQVRHILHESGAKPAQLKLELTESLLLVNVDDVIAKMRELKLLGIYFSLDDFGTGYSSLQYIKLLPLDQLKIDKSFVHDINSDTNDAAIVKTIIVMSEALGLNVIAEGVETQAQRDFLDHQGCHSFQGYLFGKPLPIEEFEALLKLGSL
jgi:diguanylate cyclase (GGDEF)-like protein/PAS domain S-box-containing protein